MPRDQSTHAAIEWFTFTVESAERMAKGAPHALPNHHVAEVLRNFVVLLDHVDAWEDSGELRARALRVADAHALIASTLVHYMPRDGSQACFVTSPEKWSPLPEHVTCGPCRLSAAAWHFNDVSEVDRLAREQVHEPKQADEVRQLPEADELRVTGQREDERAGDAHEQRDDDGSHGPSVAQGHCKGRFCEGTGAARVGPLVCCACGCAVCVGARAIEALGRDFEFKWTDKP